MIAGGSNPESAALEGAPLYHQANEAVAGGSNPVAGGANPGLPLSRRPRFTTRPTRLSLKDRIQTAGGSNPGSAAFEEAPLYHQANEAVAGGSNPDRWRIEPRTAALEAPLLYHQANEAVAGRWNPVAGGSNPRLPLSMRAPLYRQANEGVAGGSNQDRWRIESRSLKNRTQVAGGSNPHPRRPCFTTRLSRLSLEERQTTRRAVCCDENNTGRRKGYKHPKGGAACQN